MDICSKLYIDYLHDKSAYYADMSLEKEIEKLETELKAKLSFEQEIIFQDLTRVSKHLRAYKDLHLIKYVIEHYND